MGDAASTAVGFLDFGWVWSQLSGGNPVPFLSWTAATLLIGLCAGMAVRNWRLNRKVRSELGLKSGFERVNTVERLIEKADELASQSVGVAERDARIASLEAELAGRPTREDVDERDTRIASLEEELRRVSSIVDLKEERVQGMRDALITRLGSEGALTRKDVEDIVCEMAGPLQWQEIEGPDDTEDEISSFERTLSILNNREKWCLRQVIDVEETNRTFSTSAGGFLKPTYENLAGLGILTNLGDREIRGEAATAYTISPEWRTWLSGHDGIFAGVTMEDAGLG